MTIQAIQTGRVKITHSWRQGRGSGIGRIVHSLFDRSFTEWLPVYAWLIEHPEGLIVIDTGITADANKPVWFPPHMRLVQQAATFDMSADQEIGPQLARLGYSCSDVRWVVMTHLHQDHDGGLRHFPHAEFLVSRAEWNAAAGLKGRLGGYLNHRWPAWFQPKVVDFPSERFGPFTGCYTFTKAANVHLVPTPGHSAGHLSVILFDDDLAFVFAGDSSYSEELLLAYKIDGIGVDPDVQRDTYRRLLTFAKHHRVVYLPSHDPDSASRLQRRTTIDVTKAKE